MKSIYIIFLFLLTQNIHSQISPHLAWYREYNDPANSFDFFNSSKIDNSGIYFAGGAYNNNNNADAFLIKYSFDGDSLFSIHYLLQPDIRDEFYSLAIDTGSNLYLSGAA